MSEKLIKLNAEETDRLNGLYRKSVTQTKLTAAGVAVVLFIFSVIPSGILDFFSSNGTSSVNKDPARSILQQWGTGTWAIVYIITMVVITILLIYSKKIFQLKKDMKQAEKIELDVVVVSKFADDKAGNYAMRISSDTLKNKKIVLEREQFNQFVQGQKLTIDIYKNSMLLVSDKV